MIVSRSGYDYANKTTSEAARGLLYRDIPELRRVYRSPNYPGPKIPNSALQELIELNKKMYPNAFRK